MRASLASAQSLSYEDQAVGSMAVDPDLRKLLLLLSRLGLEGFGEAYRTRVTRILAEFEDEESESEEEEGSPRKSLTRSAVEEEPGTGLGGRPRANSLVHEMKRRKMDELGAALTDGDLGDEV